VWVEGEGRATQGAVMAPKWIQLERGGSMPEESMLQSTRSPRPPASAARRAAVGLGALWPVRQPGRTGNDRIDIAKVVPAGRPVLPRHDHTRFSTFHSPSKGSHASGGSRNAWEAPARAVVVTLLPFAQSRSASAPLVRCGK
jgi:hypothetical protein